MTTAFLKLTVRPCPSASLSELGADDPVLGGCGLPLPAGGGRGDEAVKDHRIVHLIARAPRTQGRPLTHPVHMTIIVI